MIKREPSELPAHLRFERAYDGLDELQVARLTLPHGGEIALVRHEHAPRPGTEVFVSHTVERPGSLLGEVLRLLDLSADDLAWVREGV